MFFPSGFPTALVVIVILLFFIVLIVLASRLRKCPADKIMVVYGKLRKNQDGTSRSCECVHGGWRFIVPLIQSYQFLDLSPISIPIDLKNANIRRDIRIDLAFRFTVGISTETGVMLNAAERLLGIGRSEIRELAHDIIFGQLRVILATMDVETTDTDRDKLLEAVSRNVETALKVIGLRLISVIVAADGEPVATPAVADETTRVAFKH